MYGQRWKVMPVSVRLAIADEMQTASSVAIAAKYGVHERTVHLWRRYAKSPNGFAEYRKKRARIQSQSQIDAYRDVDDKRDDRTLAVYRALRCDLGQTAKAIAELTGYCRETVGRDLDYLSQGELAERRDGLWYHSGKTLGRSFGDEDDPPIVRILGGRCNWHRKLKAANANW